MFPTSTACAVHDQAAELRAPSVLQRAGLQPAHPLLCFDTDSLVTAEHCSFLHPLAPHVPAVRAVHDQAAGLRAPGLLQRAGLQPAGLPVQPGQVAPPRSLLDCRQRHLPSLHRRPAHQRGVLGFCSVLRESAELSSTAMAFLYSLDKWHHLAVSWTAVNGTFRVYTDGLLINEVHLGSALVPPHVSRAASTALVCTAWTGGTTSQSPGQLSTAHSGSIPTACSLTRCTLVSCTASSTSQQSQAPPGKQLWPPSTAQISDTTSQFPGKSSTTPSGSRTLLVNKMHQSSGASGQPEQADRRL